jgi:hypothetical protein
MKMKTYLQTLDETSSFVKTINTEYLLRYLKKFLHIKILKKKVLLLFLLFNK